MNGVSDGLSCASHGIGAPIAAQHPNSIARRSIAFVGTGAGLIMGIFQMGAAKATSGAVLGSTPRGTKRTASRHAAFLNGFSHHNIAPLRARIFCHR
jgi:hypothetical protein